MLVHYLKLVYLRYKRRLAHWWKLNRAKILACFNKFNDYLFRIINAFIDLFGIILQGFWFVFGGALTFMWAATKKVLEALYAVLKAIGNIFIQKEPEAEDEEDNLKKAKIQEPSND